MEAHTSLVDPLDDLDDPRILAVSQSSDHGISSSLSAFFGQYSALVLKNLRLSLRNWKGTLGILLSPILVVLFLLAMQQVANLVLKQTNPHPQGRHVSALIPACQAAPTKNSHCFTMAYAPQGVPWVEKLMRSLASSNSLDFDKTFKGFGNQTGPTGPLDFFVDNSTMSNFFEHNQNVTQTGIIFFSPYYNEFNRGDEMPNEIGYWIFYNQTHPEILESTILSIESEIGNTFTRRNNSLNENGAKSRSRTKVNSRITSELEIGQDLLFQKQLFASAGQSTDDFDSLTDLMLEEGNRDLDNEDPNIIEESATKESRFSFDIIFKNFPQPLLRFSQISVSAQSGGTLYFIPPMIVFFVLLTEIVSEKEARLRLGMRMMGLSNSAYWLSWYTHGCLWIFLITVFQYLAGLACRYDFFTNSNAFSVLSLFFTFGIAMMTFAFFLSTLIENSKTAQTVGYAIILVGFVFQGILNSANGVLVDMLWLRGAAAWIVAIRRILELYPPFNLAKVFSDISALSSSIVSISEGRVVQGPGFLWEDMYKSRLIINTTDFFVASPPPSNSYLTLLLNIAIFGIFAWYLDHVLPGEHGTSYPFYFPFTPEYWGIKRKRPSPDMKKGRETHNRFEDDQTNGDYDSDVEREQDVAFDDRIPVDSSKFALRLLNISKSYSKFSFIAFFKRVINKCRKRPISEKDENTTHAVANVSLTIRPGELFTLLGHNGAGKTTLISMLTGLFKPTSGRASIYGLDLEDQLVAVQNLIGVCPQHDVLWPELTAREHLLLFARVKGIPSYLIDREVQDKLVMVGLESVADKPAGSFSGGMKRRLSVAVSCIGDPKLIYLDEPSSGLDPVNKRKIWRMIEGLKKDRAIVLTTHSMEEAEVLSDRIGIMAFGKVRAIGDSLHLKNRYGDGYRISVVVDTNVSGKSSDLLAVSQSKSMAGQSLLDEILAKWPSVHLVSNDSGFLLLGCPRDFQEEMPALLDFIKAAPNVKEWGLSHSTLESVFLAVTKQHNFVYDDIVDDVPTLPLAEEADSLDSNTKSASASLSNYKDQAPRNRTKLKSFPIKALIKKNLTLQWRQRFSTICQVTTPLLIILILVILKVVIKSQLGPEALKPRIFPGLPLPLNPSASIAAELQGLDCQQFMFFADNESPIKAGYLYPNGSGSGLLGRIPQYRCTTRIPHNNSAHATYSFFKSLSESLEENEFISEEVHNISNKVPNFNVGKDEETIQNQLYSNLSKLTAVPIRQVDKYPTGLILPDAYTVFHDIDPSGLHLEATVSVNTHPTRAYHRRNNFTRLRFRDRNYAKLKTNLLPADLVFEHGFLQGMAMIVRAFREWSLSLRGISASAPAYNNLIVTQPMPQISVDNIWAFLELAGTLLYPLGLTLQIPLYLYILTLEKSEKLREMMLSHGLKTRYYHLINYLFFFVIYAIAAAIFWISGVITASRFFSTTHWSILMTYFLGWGFSLVSLSCFISSFINSPRVATVAGYVIALFGSSLAFIVCVGIYGPAPVALQTTYPFWTYIWPQFSFSRGMYLLNDACALKGVCYGPIWKLHWSDELSKALLGLYLAGIIYYILFLYLDAVLPREFGVPKHPLFFLPCLHKKKKAQRDALAMGHLGITNSAPTELFYSNTDEDNENRSLLLESTEDVSDVVAEKQRVLSGDYPLSSPLVIHGLRKVYDSGKVALKQLFLAVSENECFGLLGENGAGKSTTISMLTGMFSPTSGTALVGGYDIRTEIDKVHLSMGLCPQFDILWNDLTVEEHLLFYARLKGIPSKHEKDHVKQMMQDVGLLKSAHKRSDELSGGMRRRLSIAISLVGDSSIVFMDEPTTGLDVASRRQVWAIIERAKKGRAIVLTTHSMDEAELLCNRIGILAHGQMRCIGNQQHLKSMFGQGVRLKINYKTDTLTQEMNKMDGGAMAKAFILKSFPGAQISGDYNGTQEYHIDNNTQLSHIFRTMEMYASSNGITDWAVSQIGLEDVFQRVVQSAEPESSPVTQYDTMDMV